jgi:hypothetical protein
MAPFFRALRTAVAWRRGAPGVAFDTIPRAFDRGTTAYARAMLAAQRGDTARALVMLERSLEEGMPLNEMRIENDWLLEPLWRTAKFKELLRPKG